MYPAYCLLCFVGARILELIADAAKGIFGSQSAFSQRVLRCSGLFYLYFVFFL